MNNNLMIEKLTPEEKKINQEVIFQTFLFKALPISLGSMFLMKGLMVRGTVSNKHGFFKVFASGWLGYTIGGSTKWSTLSKRLLTECPNGFYAKFTTELKALSSDEMTEYFKLTRKYKMVELPSVMLAGNFEATGPSTGTYDPSLSMAQQGSNVSPPAYGTDSSAPPSSLDNRTIKDVFQKYQTPGLTGEQDISPAAPSQPQTKDPWAVWNDKMAQNRPTKMDASSTYQHPHSSSTSPGKPHKNKYGDEGME